MYCENSEVYSTATGQIYQECCSERELSPWNHSEQSSQSNFGNSLPGLFTADLFYSPTQQDTHLESEFLLAHITYSGHKQQEGFAYEGAEDTILAYENARSDNTWGHRANEVENPIPSTSPIQQRFPVMVPGPLVTLIGLSEGSSPTRSSGAEGDEEPSPRVPGNSRSRRGGPKDPFPPGAFRELPGYRGERNVSNLFECFVDCRNRRTGSRGVERRGNLIAHLRVYHGQRIPKGAHC